jgi:PAS domain S-box-containing protein
MIMKQFVKQNISSKIILFITLFLSLHFPSPAQLTTLNDTWRWLQFTTDDGLPSNQVLSITETKSGTVWATTEFGAAWYNGFYWQSVSKKDGLPERLSNVMIPDDKDSVYMLISGEIYYGGQNGFRKIPITINGTDVNVNSIALLQKELLFTTNEKLYILHNTSASDFYFNPINLDNQKIYYTFQTRYSTWISTNLGLYRWENNEWILKLESAQAQLKIAHLAEDTLGNGIAFIASPRSYFGVWEWSRTSQPQKNQTIGITNILALDIYSDENAIIIKEPEVVQVRQNGKWTSLQSVPIQLKNAHLLKYRYNGDIWVGTETGLYLHRITSKRWDALKFPEADLRNNVNEIIIARDSTMWLATANGLVIRKPNGSIQTVENVLNTKLHTVTGLIEDKLGNIWISSGFSFEGTYRWDGKRWKYYGLKDGLDAGFIHKIKKDRNDRLWFLGISRKDFEQRGVDKYPGAFVYDHEKFIHWGTKEGLINDCVYSFDEAPDGSYWFATLEGISQWMPDKLNPSTGRWKHWTEKQGLKINRIFTIAVDNQNRVWFGDQTYGLGCIENDSVKYFTTTDGLVSNAIWDIRLDKKNRLWISARGGIGLYSNETWFNISLNDGLSNTRVWPILPLENKVYIGTSGGGLEILNLEDAQTIPPIVNILKPVTQGNTLFTNCKAFSFWGEQASRDIEIRYKIDDNPWTSWGKIRQIIEPNLPYGSHTLTVQTKGLLGNFRTDIKSVIFTIEPPIYLRPVFYIPISVLSLGLILLSYIYIKKKREQETLIRKSEFRYRSLFESANDAIMIFEPKDEIILEVNKKACEVYGYERAEFVGKSLKEITKNVKRGEEHIQKILEHGELNEYETTHFTKTGRAIHLLVNASAIDYDGRKAILSINRDITERKQAEAEKALLAQTVASAKDAICITDLDNNFLFVNDAFIEMYGYKEEELYGKHVNLIASTEVPEEIQKEIHKTTIEKGGWNGEVTNKRKDGTTFPVELWSSVVYDIEGKPVALVGVARDITERKKLEKEREQLITNLQNALAEVKTLSGLLPICSSCKKIRDDKGYWGEVESYLMKHTDATFTHGLCPECTKKYFPEIYKKMEQNGTKF